MAHEPGAAERLQGKQPGVYPDGQLWTLQRRVKVWPRELPHGMIFPAARSEATGAMAAATGATQ
jgi:hypothetical protein